MTLFKIGLVLLTGAGFGLGIDKLSNTDIMPDNQEDYYGHMEYTGCHQDDDFLLHMLDNLSEEDAIIVNAKIDELLVTYDTTLDDLENNFDLRYNFMNDLMTFLFENDIEYHYRYHDDIDEDNGWHGGMGMH